MAILQQLGYSHANPAWARLMLSREWHRLMCVGEVSQGQERAKAAPRARLLCATSTRHVYRSRRGPCFVAPRACEQTASSLRQSEPPIYPRPTRTMSIIRAIESGPVHALHTVRRALLSPMLSGSLLLALLATPEEVRHAILKRLSLPPTYDLGVAKTVLQVLLGLGIVRTINHALSSMAANSWRATAASGWDWPNEVAVVTGGCSGIGYNIVERLARRQVKVAIFDIQDLPKAFEGHPQIRYYKCDITSPESVAEAADGVRRDFGHPSILINNAGITKPMPILKMTQDFLLKIFGVNTMSHWTTVQQFLPRMIQLNKGHVVTVASIASFVALSKGADYSATKAAALSFHESLASELKHFYKADSVLTTVVHPNFVRTPLVKDFGDRLEEEGVRMLSSDHVAGKIVDQVFSRRGGQVIIPDTQSPISSIRGWPTWLQVLARDAIGKSATKL